jgi:hypothetical protein
VIVDLEIANDLLGLSTSAWLWLGLRRPSSRRSASRSPAVEVAPILRRFKQAGTLTDGLRLPPPV